MGFQVETELATQPENWRQAAAAAASFAPALPQPGERVAFVGCGTSWFMSMAAANLRESLGLGESDNYTASEFNYSRKYDRVIATTRTGTTTETVEVLQRLKGKVPTTIFTAAASGPGVDTADQAVVLDFAAEQSVVSTRFATSCLAVMRAHFGQDLTAAIADAADMLKVDVSQMAQAEQISFLGTGWTIALANEAALKTREMAQYWAESHPAMDYRHGPISIAQAGRMVWSFGPAPKNLQADVEKTGAVFETRPVDPMAHLVLAHRVAVEIAKLRGVNPDQPRHLTKSVVLT